MSLDLARQDLEMKCGLRGDVWAHEGATVRLSKPEKTGTVVAYELAILEPAKLEKANYVCTDYGATLYTPNIK